MWRLLKEREVERERYKSTKRCTKKFIVSDFGVYESTFKIFSNRFLRNENKLHLAFSIKHKQIDKGYIEKYLNKMPVKYFPLIKPSGGGKKVFRIYKSLPIYSRSPYSLVYYAQRMSDKYLLCLRFCQIGFNLNWSPECALKV